MLIEKDINQLIKDAESGDVAAQIYLGYHYLYGFNIQRNLNKSYEIFNRLAEEGYTYAADALRNCFDGPGELKDDFETIYGDLREIIAVWDNKELHESQSPIQMLRLLNHAYYNRLLADSFLDGVGVPKNEAQGFALYEYLHEKLDSTEVRYAMCLINGTGTKRDEKKGFACLSKMHEENPRYGLVSYHLAMCHVNGWGTAVDYTKALSMFKKSAKSGYAKANYDLGVMYRSGEGVEVDMEQAIKYYQKGLAAGVGCCATNLGVIYNNGINGVPQDFKLAKETYKRGVHLGDKDSMFNLAMMYYQGSLSDGVPDYDTAVRYLKMAADLGEPDSIYHLGICYLEGTGVEKDPEYATDLIIDAARRGLPGAQELLKQNNIDWRG